LLHPACTALEFARVPGFFYSQAMYTDWKLYGQLTSYAGQPKLTLNQHGRIMAGCIYYNLIWLLHLNLACSIN